MKEMKTRSGLELSKAFFQEEVRPILNEYNDKLKYDAALIGAGSEVLGYDDETSRDHHWGPRIQIFLSTHDFKKMADEIRRVLSKKIKPTFRGYSTHWSEPDQNDSNNQFLEQGIEGKINHRVEIYTISQILDDRLGVKKIPLTPIDWCLIPEHRLLEIISGDIFHENLGELRRIRKYFQYYPPEIRFYKFRSLWSEVSELFHLMGRAGMTGDNIGSHFISNQLTQIAAKIKFCIEAQYGPYPKWFGRALKELNNSALTVKLIEKVHYSENWWDRQNLLCNLFIHLGNQFNNLKLLPYVDIRKKQFFTRPQYIIDTGDLIRELTERIPAELKSKRIPIGTVNEWIGHSRLIDSPHEMDKFRDFYKKK